MGIVLGLAAGAAYATYSWAASRLIAAGESPQGAMGAVFGLAALWLIPLAIATGGPLLRTADSLGIICYLAVGPMLVGYTLFGRGLRTNSASVATTLSLVEPVVAAALSEILLGQRLNGPARIGVALIAVSVLTLTIGSEQNPSISPAQQAPAAVGPTAPLRPHTGIAEA
jgi:DME family drug/metabolite transporter